MNHKDIVYAGGMLSGEEIKREVELGRIVIDPYDSSYVKANSYDVRLASLLYRVVDQELDFKKVYQIEEILLPQEGFFLEPGELYLGCTYERTYTPYHIPEYNGRSTTGRYFLFSHITAGFGDIGFNGHWTLEIYVPRRLKIYPLMRIGQINFQTVYGEIKDRYDTLGGHYGEISRVPRLGVPNNI
jgi:dCTP deaminase